MTPPRRARAGLASLPLLAVLVSGCGDGGKLDHGTVFGAGSRAISVSPGERFSLHWKLAVVPGNDWKVVAPQPDSSVVKSVGTDKIAPDGGTGDGGELYLVFEAGSKGSTKMTVADCFSCDPMLKKIYGSRKTYEVTVE